MDKFDVETDTGKIENTLDFSKLSCDQKIVEKFTFRQAKNAQV